MAIVAGVDTHKEFHVIVILDGVGKVLHTISVPTDASGYSEAIAVARTYGVDTWGLEGTGSYGRAFASTLIEAGYPVFEVPGIITKRHRKSMMRHGKSDTIDAQAIAGAVLREPDRLPQFHECPEQEVLRLRYDQRDRLVRERTMLINRLRSSALRLKISDVPNTLTTDASVAILRKMLSSLHGKDIIQEALVDEMFFELTSLERLNAEIRRLERVMAPFVKRLAPELLALRGVSVTVAAGLIGHAGNIRNLRNADAFAVRSATAPIPWSSGKHIRVRTNTGGDRQLNRLFHVIAFNQVRAAGHPGHIYYHRKLTEGKTPRAAIRALKRQLTTVVFYRLKSCFKRTTTTSPEAIAA